MQTLRGLSKTKIQYIYQQGKYLKGTFLILRWTIGTGKWCVTTPRAIGCHARRNLIKRRMRSALQQIKSDPLNIDVVICCTQKIQGVNFFEIARELESLIKLI